ncbi:DUF4411 family protein [Hwanghaeella sp.]|uniref:DUF4411 family protein n=1 Tax=Hwanghaeella sp. TaxID=2605943 RepID=UPI003CCBE80E
MYVIDANCLIFAKNYHFQFERVPQFWSWLQNKAEADLVKMPIETWSKIGDYPPDRRDELAEWAIANKDALILADRAYDARFPDVLHQYTQPDGAALTEAETNTVGDDYALIASALHGGYTVVTDEVSRQSAQRANRKVPDVCADLNVPCIDLDGRRGGDALINILDFRVDWDKP